MTILYWFIYRFTGLSDPRLPIMIALWTTNHCMHLQDNSSEKSKCSTLVTANKLPELEQAENLFGKDNNK